MKVANRKCVRRLAMRNMKSSKTRNIIAAIAIVLTTVLFTTLFTIVVSIIDGIQEAGFRQTGTYAHGAFARLYEEQYEELKNDAELKETGVRMLVGNAEDAPFNKTSVEISYCDENCAKFMYLTPKTGTLPKEGTNEAAVDKKILELLEVEPVIGTEFELTFEVDGEPVTRTFSLSGYWETDKLAPACNVLISKSMADDICKDFTPDVQSGKYAGVYDLYYMLDGSRNLEDRAEAILEKYDYQSKDVKEDNYIQCEININYAGNRGSKSDIEVVAVIFSFVLLIMITGYLVINNIFRISAENDIKRYGLLKTIGTTKKQIRKIIYMEVVILSVTAIPTGIIIGYGVGVVLAPIVVKQFNDIVILVSANPFIFAFSAVFSFLTVLMSSLRPAKSASKVSPVEALRYTESNISSVKKTRKRKRVSVFQMAMAGVGRNKLKTITTIISLTLAVILLNITFSVANSFDMDKYLRDVKSDFMAGHANYFRASGHIFSEEYSLPEKVINDINDTGMVTEGGVAYLCGKENQIVYQYVPEDVYINNLYYMDDEALNYMLEHEEKVEERYEARAELFGMDDFLIEQLNCVEGDVSKLYEDGNYIVGIYTSDDYGNAEKDSHWGK